MTFTTVPLSRLNATPLLVVTHAFWPPPSPPETRPLPDPDEAYPPPLSAMAMLKIGLWEGE